MREKTNDNSAINVVSYLSAKAPDKDTKSDLLKKTDVRNFIRKNSYTFK